MGSDFRSDQGGDSFRDDNDSNVFPFNGRFQGATRSGRISDDHSFCSRQAESQDGILITDHEKFQDVTGGLEFPENHDSDDQTVDRYTFCKSDEYQSTAGELWFFTDSAHGGRTDIADGYRGAD